MEKQNAIHALAALAQETRLDVFRLHVPPLRQRREDVPLLVDHFIGRFREALGKPIRTIADDALDRLVDHAWPGNVRELENVIEGAFAIDVGEVVQAEDLSERIRDGRPALRPHPVQRSASVPPPSSAGAADIRGHRDAAERAAIEEALRQTGGDKAAAAQRLGMARSTFYRRVKELGIA